jgi:hypothetical protein
MISLQFSKIDLLFEELDLKIEGIKELVSPNSKTQIAKAVFTITSKQFVKDFSKESIINPKKYFHMYEWNKVGNNNQKLFVVKRNSINYGNLKVGFKFKQSRTNVPIPNMPKKSNSKRSVTKKSIFANKAEVMESGKPISFTTKDYIAFLSQKDGKVHFVAPHKIVKISHPGGRETKNSFEKFAKKWYNTKAEKAVISSRLFLNIENAVAKSLDGNKKDKKNAKEAIRVVTEKYAQGVVEV